MTTRALVEAVPLACAAAVAGAALHRDVVLLGAWLYSTAALVAWASVAPRLAPRVRAAAALASIAGGAISLTDLARAGADPLWLAAAVAGALYAAMLIWRGTEIAATAPSWRSAGVMSGVAVVALGLAAIAFPVKRDVAAIAIAAGVAGTIALATARGVEETFANRKGSARAAPGWWSSLAIASGAVVVAGAFPILSAGLALAADVLGPLVRALVVIVVTPFVYLTEALVLAILPFLLRIRIGLPFAGAGRLDPQTEAEYARQFSIEAQIFLQRFLLILALLVIGMLIARAVLSRVITMRASAPVERERIEGAPIRELLGRLFPARRAQRPARPAGDDPVTRVARAYWDLLALAERAGPGWREPSQTPREHRAVLEGGAWRGADDVVAAFERARYGPPPTQRDAEAAERAFGEVVAAVSARA